jgi:indole-3-glycerol phosphate synthase
VAESGLATARDAARIAAAGYDLALVGSALMSAADPAQLMRDMLSAGREARTRERRS